MVTNIKKYIKSVWVFVDALIIWIIGIHIITSGYNNWTTTSEPIFNDSEGSAWVC